MTAGANKKRVCYYYDGDVGNYYYGQNHPMKPHRIRMTHNLLLNYGLYRKMEIYVSHRHLQNKICIYLIFLFLPKLLLRIHIVIVIRVNNVSHSQRPHKASMEEMTKYHADEYIKFLRNIRYFPLIFLA